jgi:hypothetical protein
VQTHAPEMDNFVVPEQQTLEMKEQPDIMTSQAD